jgi:hypothetical protein
MRDARGRFTKGPDVVPRMAPGDITVLAREIVTNLVYIANDAQMNLSFPVLLWAPKWSAEFIASIGAVWEYRSMAGPTGINGRPMFFSCHLLNRLDLEPLFSEMARMRAALEEPA